MRKLSEKRKYLLRSVLAVLFAGLMLLPDLLTPAADAWVTQEDIDKLEAESDRLAKEKKELEASLAQLSSDKSAAMRRKTLLDQRIGVLTSEIANAETLIASYEELIAQREAELADAEVQEENQYALFCRRVRDMEERGTISYWSVLFRATSFSDMLSQLDWNIITNM